MGEVTKLESMIGITLTRVRGCEERSGRMRCYADDGLMFVFDHEQDCCERVEIAQVDGDPFDLLGSPIVMAEASSSTGGPKADDDHGSRTWTFYRFATAKGYVTVRWCGTSNGYYSERVDFTVMRHGNVVETTHPYRMTLGDAYAEKVSK